MDWASLPCSRSASTRAAADISLRAQTPLGRAGGRQRAAAGRGHVRHVKGFHDTRIFSGASAACFRPAPDGAGREIRAALKKLSGQDHGAADPHTTFLELGFDSLLLTQVAQAFRKEFSVKVTFRQLLEDYATMDALAGYLDAQMPPAPPVVPRPPWNNLRPGWQSLIR